MKILTLFLLSLACLVARGQSSTANEKETEVLINKIRAKTITGEERKELKAFANDIQNKGQHFDEHDHDYRSALENTDKAIFLFDALEDTLDVANNKKFRGYLLGRFGRFAEAKAAISDAIH